MNFLRLGWRAPRQNTFTGRDAVPLRNSFEDLQRWMTWPYVGLRFDGVFDLTATLAIPNWQLKSSAASPFVAGDPYSLFRPTTDKVQVPRDFDTWMLQGSVACVTTGGAATAVLTVAWRINGANGIFMGHSGGTAATRQSTPVMTPVRKGDTVEVAFASTDAAEDLTSAEAWMYFLPLG